MSLMDRYILKFCIHSYCKYVDVFAKKKYLKAVVDSEKPYGCGSENFCVHLKELEITRDLMKDSDLGGLTSWHSSISSIFQAGVEEGDGIISTCQGDISLDNYGPALPPAVSPCPPWRVH